jgi:hypothetical protein
MHVVRLMRGLFAVALIFVSLTTFTLRASADTTGVSGTIKDSSGVAISGARISATGPMSAGTVSDDSGSFTLTLSPGLYHIAVEKGGFQPTSLNDVAVVSGQTIPLNVTLSAASLTSLRTIGSVTVNSHGTSSMNLGAATTNYLPAQAFSNVGNAQMNDVLEHLPDVTIQHMGSQQDSSIIVGGLQPYETQVLIDGHPIALGQYGVWLSQYFPTYLIGGIETQSGPGNTTPFANIAVAGTANILTPGFTHKMTGEVTNGIDNYGSQYSNLLFTNSSGKFDYVVAAGAAGANGPYLHKQGCAVLEDFASVANTPTSTGIVQFCGDMSGSLVSKGEMLKMRYEFSPTTSFEIGFVGAFGGYSPQGSAWGNSLGSTTIEQCMVADPFYCTNPANANLIGKQIQAYSWYPGTLIQSTQQLYTGEFRTSIGDNTLLIRPYLGAIQPESYDGTDEGRYPSFFSPPGTVPSLAPGVQIPSTGLPAPNAFESMACPPGNIYAFSQINSPQNTIVSVGGQEECFQYPYTFYEQDKLYGSTFSFIHPFGDSFLDFTYDFHGQSTLAYANAPTNVTVPFSAARYSTFSLTADLRMIRNLSFNVGVYQTLWGITGETAQLDAAGNPVLSGGFPVIIGLDRRVSRIDPHIAVTFQPQSNLSLRAAWGTSETFPFIGDVSGTAAYQPFAQSAPLYTLGIFTEKNPNLLPEFSQAEDVGGDFRLPSGAVFSIDYQNTTVHNVFQQLTLAENTTFQGNTGVLGIFLPINVAQLSSQLITAKYSYAPAHGFGYNFQVAADRSILTGVPQGAYNANPGFPVNGVQVCGNGLFTPGLATCIPYLKGYGQFTYSTPHGTYAAIGVAYWGKNNPYYQPPFALVDATVRQPIEKYLDLQLSVENLLNSNTYLNLPAPNIGTPVVAETTGGQATYLPDLLPAPPRTFRLQARLHVGR